MFQLSLNAPIVNSQVPKNSVRQQSGLVASFKVPSFGSLVSAQVCGDSQNTESKASPSG